MTATEVPLSQLLSRRFRANPEYELVVFDRLPIHEQKAFQNLKDDPDFYGLLMGKPPAKVRSKAVSHQAALLFLTLKRAAPLPFYVTDNPSEEVAQSVVRLVMEGVLEVEAEEGFIGGTAAYGLLFPSASDEEPVGFLRQLSRDAVRYGAALEGLTTVEMSTRMYFYNRLPASAYWRNRFPTREAMDAQWGLQHGLARLPGGNRWERVQEPAAGWDWHCWHLVNAPSTLGGSAIHKLYVSSAPQHVGQALAETLRALTKAEAPCFKIGGDLIGLLRPDRIVCYFADYAQLNEAAGHLGKALEGLPAHGVPFTSEVFGDGLISRGVDPPANEQAFGWLGRQSWRLWITNHLAAALVAAKSEKNRNVPAWRFALDRLRLEGVDIESWEPVELTTPGRYERKA